MQIVHTFRADSTDFVLNLMQNYFCSYFHAKIVLNSDKSLAKNIKKCLKFCLKPKIFLYTG